MILERLKNNLIDYYIIKKGILFRVINDEKILSSSNLRLIPKARPDFSKNILDFFKNISVKLNVIFVFFLHVVLYEYIFIEVYKKKKEG